MIENQLKEQLYNWREDVRPRVVGKFDEHRNWVLPSAGELTPAMIARAIAKRIEKFHTSDRIKDRLAFLDRKERALSKDRPDMKRIPYFCAGCPHNSTSTEVPEGSHGPHAGIGCHYMAQLDGPGHRGRTRRWAARAPTGSARRRSTRRGQRSFARHLGDGTYNHSGLSGGAGGGGVGRHHDLQDPVQRCGRDDRRPAPRGRDLEPGSADRAANPGCSGRCAAQSSSSPTSRTSTRLEHGVPGGRRRSTTAPKTSMTKCSATLRDRSQVPDRAMIYDQTCAAEKTAAAQARHSFPDPAKARVHQRSSSARAAAIAASQSNCVAVHAGRNRASGASGRSTSRACNKDYSCLNGFLPELRHRRGRQAEARQAGKRSARCGVSVPARRRHGCPQSTSTYDVVVTGVGGTGVVTIGAI